MSETSPAIIDYRERSIIKIPLQRSFSLPPRNAGTGILLRRSSRWSRLRATLRLNSPQRRFTTASLKPAAGTEQLSLRVPRHAVSLTGMRGLRLLRAVLVEKRSFTSTAGCIPVTTWRRRQRNSVALRLRAAPEPAQLSRRIWAMEDVLTALTVEKTPHRHFMLVHGRTIWRRTSAEQYRLRSESKHYCRG